MRHKIAGNKLNRNQKWREATVRDLAKATLIQERICTTLAKAKEARKLVDRLITLGKKGTLADKRRAFAVLNDHKLVSDLFNVTSPRFSARKGGYTRIIPYVHRRGDNAKLAFLELTERKEVKVSQPKSDTKKSTKAEVSDAEIVSDEKPKKTTSKTKKAPTEKGKKDDTNSKEASKKNVVGGIRKMFRRKAD